MSLLIPQPFADKADLLIKQTAKNIINGANEEDIHNLLSKELKDETQIYLVYIAANILVEALRQSK